MNQKEGNKSYESFKHFSIWNSFMAILNHYRNSFHAGCRLATAASLICLSLNAAQLGVQFNSTNNNIVSPGSLNFTNIYLTNATASRALITDSSKKITNSVVTADSLTNLLGLNTYLAPWIISVDAALAGSGAITNVPTFAGVVNNLTTYLGPGTNRVVDVILDADLGGDIDDAGDVAIFHALADQGEINPLAITVPTIAEGGPQAAEIFNRYYNRPTLMVGQNLSPGAITGATNWGWFMATNTLFYSSIKGYTQAVDSVKLYRKILATRPDNSVTIVAVGPLDNIYNLSLSAADTNSALTGYQLITNKVREIVVAAGYWPTNSPLIANNFTFNPTPIQVLNVLSNTPVQLTYFGDDIGYSVTNGYYIGNKSNTDPMRAAWEFYKSYYVGTVSRPAWGQIALLYAARGTNYRGTNWFTRQPGYSLLNHTNGVNGFITNALGNAGYINWTGTPSTNEVSAYLNELLMNAGPLNHGIEQGQTNILLKMGFEGSNTNILTIKTNAFVFDSVNHRLQAGAPFTSGLWNNQSRLLLIGTNASTSTANREPIIEAWRPQNGVDSFGQGFKLELGRWKTPTSLSGNTEVMFSTANNLNIFIGQGASWANNLSLRDDGSTYFWGYPYLLDGSIASPAIGFQSETNTGLYWPGAGALEIVTAGLQSTRYFNQGQAFSSANSLFWASGALGASIDAGISRGGADTVKIVKNLANDAGNLITDDITALGTISISSGAARYNFTDEPTTGIGYPGPQAISFDVLGNEVVRLGPTGFVTPKTNYYGFATNGLGTTLGSIMASGTGSPEGVYAAAVGSLYLRQDGGTDTAVYKKETGGATVNGWVAIAAGGGGVTDGDKGDITVTGSGATWTIDNGVVTLAKMADMATDSIIGRSTAATGVPQVLTALPWAFTGDVTSVADANALTLATNRAQQKVWLRTGTTNEGVFSSTTFWPGNGINISTTNTTGAGTNLDITITGGLGLSRATRAEWFEEFPSDQSAGSSGFGPNFLVTASGGSSTTAVVDQNHIGVGQLRSGTAVGNYASAYQSRTLMYFGGGSCTIEVMVYIDTLNGGGEEFEGAWGFGDTRTDAEQAEGVYFLYNASNANWQIVTADNSTRTTTATSTTVAADTWYKLKAVINSAGTSVEFFINNVSVGTHTTNIPVTSTRQCGPMLMVAKTVGTVTNFYVNIDYFYWTKDVTR